MKLKYFQLSCILCCCVAITAHAQYEFNISSMVPSGKVAYLLKPAPCFEIGGIIGGQDDNFHIGFGLGFMSPKPTQDTFRTYAIGPGGLLPGYEVIHSYQVLLIDIRTEYVFMPTKKISPLAGFDLNFDVISIADDYYAETLEQSSTTGDKFWTLAALPRIGLQYNVSEKITLLGGLGRSMSFVGTVDSQSYWKPYIGIRYFPD